MKRYLLYVVLLILSLPALADGLGEITYVDWKELKIDSILPVYNEVIPLESDYRLYDYKVSVEYPEYKPLTTKEQSVITRYAEQIHDSLSVESSVGVLRREGMLDVSFVPVIRRDGKYQKLISFRLSITPVLKAKSRRVTRATSSRYAEHSVLSSGKWVKISITEDGIYSLTRSSLKKMGFTDPTKVHLYGYGGHLQDEAINAGSDYDDLEEVPLYKKDDNTWLFWGNGLLYWDGDTRVRNTYANAACYFLTEGETNSGIQTLPASAESSSTVYSTFTNHALYEKDEYAWFSGGRNLYESTNYGSSNVHTYTLSTPLSQGDEKLTVAFTAGAKTETTLTTTVNGTAMSETQTLAALSTYTYATLSNHTFDVSSLAKDEKNWTIKLNSTSGNDARLDYLSMSYTCAISPANDNGFILFTRDDPDDAEYDVTGTPANIQVMRVGEAGDPAKLLTGRAKDETTLSVVVDDASRNYVAFDVTHSFPEPTYVGAIENQDLHAVDSLDMVIIIPTSGKLAQQAQRLAAAHEYYDGLRVGIVLADHIYNEFSSGTPDATAYRRFMKMLYDRAPNVNDAPRYLLLMGDAAWDNRMLSSAWRNYSPDDYLLCYESDNSVSDTKSYVMEDYFGLLDDGEGSDLLKDKSDLGIGRFPVTAASEAKVMVDKAISFMSNANAGSWKNVVCIMGDDGDENEHMIYADDVAERIKSANPEMEVRKVMWDAYTRVSSTKSNTYPEVTSLLKSQMDEGAMVMNYTGHASTYTLSHEFVLNVEDFAAFKSSKLPLWVTAACDVMPFDGQSENIGETAVLNEGGAALAFYGTTRTVYASQNLAMNRYFMQYLFASDSKGNRYRLGDAVRLAKNAIISGKQEFSLAENKLQYVLLGDPALTIGAPRQRVVLDSINGTSLAENDQIALKAGSRVRMSGHVTDASKNKLSDFVGVLSARVYDSEQTITCNNNAGAKNVFTFVNRSNVLYNAQDSIKNGCFSLSFIVPVDINYSDDSGRVVFYAINEDKSVEANGYSEDFTLGGVSDELDTDTIGPQMVAYLNSTDFQDGDEVNATPFFIAGLYDESGVNVSGNGIGHDLTLCIDGKADYTYSLNDYYVGEFGDFTRGTVTYPIPDELASGPHTLEFRAWDVLNNTSSITLSFVVNPELKPNLLELTASPNPALTSTNFLISYDRPGSECQFTIDVYDYMGRRLWTHSETGSSNSGIYSIPWNLSTGAGGKVGSGIYLYRCILQCGDSKEVSKTQKIIVLNNK